MPIVTPETVDKQFILKCLDKDLCIFVWLSENFILQTWSIDVMEPYLQNTRLELVSTT